MFPRREFILVGRRLLSQEKVSQQEFAIPNKHSRFATIAFRGLNFNLRQHHHHLLLYMMHGLLGLARFALLALSRECEENVCPKNCRHFAINESFAHCSCLLVLLSIFIVTVMMAKL